MGRAYELVTERLRTGGFKTQANGRDRLRAQCPAHRGDDLNLNVAVGDQGVLLKCFSNDCPGEDVAKALGLQLSDLFDEGGRAVYDYGGGHKVVRSRTRDGKKIVQQGHPGPVTHLYRHPGSLPIEQADVVVIVEGEKCVDAALRLGEQCVTTWPGGANSADKVDLTPLAGKTVRIIADNDEPGLGAARTLRDRLAPIATVMGVWAGPDEKSSVDDIWLNGGSLSDLIPVDHLLDDQPSVDERRAATTWMSDVRSRAAVFLWDGLIPANCLTLLAGQGGVSKSTLSLWIAGHVTQGTLRGCLEGKPEKVLVIAHEDSMEEVMKPRAVANGVDTSMFGQVGVYSPEIGGTIVPRLPDDIDLVRKAIVDSGARVVIIDPIASTIGGDTDKVADVRAALDPLNVLAHELSVSILAIAHLRKGGGSGAHLISGSHAYRDAARASLLVARDEEDDTVVFTIDKSNYGEAGHSMEYDLAVVEHLTDSGELTKVAQIHGIRPSTKSAAQLINAATAPGSQKEKKAKVTPESVAAWITEQGAKRFANGTVAEAFGVRWDSQDVRAALGELAKRGVVRNVGGGSWEAIEFDEVADEVSYCQVCGIEQPCNREHTAEQYAQAAQRNR